MNWHISRRMMLRGVGAAVSLPLLDVMSTHASGEKSPPIRLAYLYIPNGVAEGAWQPEEVDKDKGAAISLAAAESPPALLARFFSTPAKGLGFSSSAMLFVMCFREVNF